MKGWGTVHLQGNVTLLAGVELGTVPWTGNQVLAAGGVVHITDTGAVTLHGELSRPKQCTEYLQSRAMSVCPSIHLSTLLSILLSICQFNYSSIKALLITDY